MKTTEPFRVIAYPAAPFTLTASQIKHLAAGLADIANAYVNAPENRERFRDWQMKRYGNVIEPRMRGPRP